MKGCLSLLIGVTGLISMANLVSADGTVPSLWIEGPASPANGDTKSIVTCPDGYYIRECHCNDATRCSNISFPDTQSCMVLNGNSSPNVTAVAMCQWSAGLTAERYFTFSRTEREEIRCSNGYTITECTMLNLRPDHPAVMTRSADACSWYFTDTTTNWGVLFYFICVKPINEA